MVSYSGIRGFGSGKVTLPSSDKWGQNMDILKDPPKGIFTRRINKISDTSSLANTIDESGDRVCEMINVYARGVNPMVSVSYSNNGRVGSGNISNSTQAFLPYRIMDRGSFVPPIKTQEHLLPLSRLPRLFTSVNTQPGFSDYSKKLECPNTNMRAVKLDLLKVCSNPTTVYKIGGNYKLSNSVKNAKNFIQSPITISADSGIKTLHTFKKNTNASTKEIYKIINSYSINANKSSKIINNKENIIVNTKKYIQNIIKGNIITNKSIGISAKNLEEMSGIVDLDSHINNSLLSGNLYSNPSQNIQNISLEDMADINNIKYINTNILTGQINSNICQNIRTTNIEEMGNGNINKNINNNMLSGSMNSNLHQNIQAKPINDTINLAIKQYTHNNTLKGHIKTNKNKNIRTTDINKMGNVDIKQYTRDITLKGNIGSNTSQNIQAKPINDTINIAIKQYTHNNTLKGHIKTNKNKNIRTTDINKMGCIDINKYTQNTNTISYDTTKTSTAKQNYIHSDIKLEKVLPYHEYTTNKNDYTIYKPIIPENTIELKPNRPHTSFSDNIKKDTLKNTEEFISRSVNLPTKNYKGGFDTKPTYTTLEKTNNINTNSVSDKYKLNKKMAENFQNRNSEKLIFLE